MRTVRYSLSTALQRRLSVPDRVGRVPPQATDLRELFPLGGCRFEVVLRRGEHRRDGEHAEHKRKAHDRRVEPNVVRGDADRQRGNAEAEVARNKERRKCLGAVFGRRDRIDDV